ncbi:MULTISPECIES: hypothetical protein [Alteromonadaceae]|uniref:Uncharacterized protein n=1 Tax=Brumicola blandensis TaxID=3075611 RepID=A0AAW8QWA9_9ALTE|nr:MULTISPECIES: hypothetical protein [unclassified Alteromonas]MDT0581296.1 hypothetical protein [Alteromonas sp. W409]MDT0626924.1 hypothetical protein [Alteromonas sp. W364]
MTGIIFLNSGDTYDVPLDILCRKRRTMIKAVLHYKERTQHNELTLQRL